MNKRVAILISGGGSNMVSLVQDMVEDHPARTCLVLSNVPDAGGLAKADTFGIPTATVDHRNFPKDRPGFENTLQEVLLQAEPDFICLAGFMRILTPEFTQKWAGRMLNIHPSLLPKYKGLNTHQRAIDAGDTEAGCSVHEVTGELDGGPILGQAIVPIHDGDTADQLAARILPMEHKLYPQVLRRYIDGMREQLTLR
ncbi:phosphoribosylglycinamide formyltransferase [Cochlodiniinecator piscidefendens]|uniref:phosphoribosylglycinamide formyltransferase n=1 Tax=Cochlodiniinecator piscidefendens TaxID=2715756 RepID=UPI001409B965